MPYNNDFNTISKRYKSLKDTEAAKKVLFENFDITEEEYKSAPLLSTLEEMDTYYADRDKGNCNVVIKESNKTNVVLLKYLKQGEDII